MDERTDGRKSERGCAEKDRRGLEWYKTPRISVLFAQYKVGIATYAPDVIWS